MTGGSRKYEQLREAQRDVWVQAMTRSALRELRAVVGKPSPNQAKPWKAEKISRSKWYQRRNQAR